MSSNPSIFPIPDGVKTVVGQVVSESVPMIEGVVQAEAQKLAGTTLPPEIMATVPGFINLGVDRVDEIVQQLLGGGAAARDAYAQLLSADSDDDLTKAGDAVNNAMESANIANESRIAADEANLKAFLSACVKIAIGAAIAAA